MMKDRVASVRAAAYIGLFLGLGGIRLLLRDSALQGSIGLNAFMALITTVLAFLIGSLALMLWYRTKSDLYEFIGAGFLGAGLLDGIHTVLCSPWFADLLLSQFPSLIPWTGAAPRVFLAVSLWLSSWDWGKEARTREPSQTSPRMNKVVVGLLAGGGFVFIAFTLRPDAYYPNIVFHRPQEAIPAVLYLLALIGYLRNGHWKGEAVKHWVVLALIVGFAGQAMFMASSRELFDAMFNAGHLLKIAGYFCVLIGVLVSMHHLWGGAQERIRELGQGTETLQEEIGVHRRAKEMLEEAHQEVEIWILERTAELTQVNKRLQVEITERKRAESELEVLHGLSRQLDSTLDLEEVLELAVMKVKEIVGVDLAVIFILDKSSGGLIIRADPPMSSKEIQNVIEGELADRLSGKESEEGDPVLLDRLSSNGGDSSARVTAFEGVESLVCVPLKAKGAAIGHIVLASRKASRFTEKDIPFLASAASVIATAIDNARLYAQTRKDAEVKALLLRELNHRVRNNLATIVGLLSMELARKKRWAGEKVLRASIERVQSLAAIHNLLVQDEFRELDLKKLVEEVATAAVKGLSWEENVTITVDGPPLRLPPNRLASLALAANELITNALKHAFRSSDTGLIRINVTQEDGEAQLEIRDNGAGISATKKSGGRKGVGLDIVASLVETDLRGQFQLREDGGTVATIRFPMPKGISS